MYIQGKTIIKRSKQVKITPFRTMYKFVDKTRSQRRVVTVVNPSEWCVLNQSYAAYAHGRVIVPLTIQTTRIYPWFLSFVLKKLTTKSTIVAIVSRNRSQRISRSFFVSLALLARTTRYSYLYSYRYERSHSPRLIRSYSYAYTQLKEWICH